MDRDGLERVLLAVGQKFISLELDKSALLRRLQCCGTWVSTAEQLSKSEVKKRAHRLKLIRAKAVKLRDLMGEGRAWLWMRGGQGLIEALDYMLEHTPEHLPASLESVEPSLEFVEQWATALKEKWQTRSKAEWLAGFHLPRIYEQFFSRRAGRSWSNGKPSGPCVRFIAATMKELNIFFSEASIVRAMTEARTGPRKRRKR